MMPREMTRLVGEMVGEEDATEWGKGEVDHLYYNEFDDQKYY
jgi:hypothetical protein